VSSAAANHRKRKGNITMAKHNKCDWMKCSAIATGRLPLGWGRVFIDEPELEENEEGLLKETGLQEGTECILCPRHLAELRSHLRTEPIIDPPRPEGLPFCILQGEPPPRPCIWQGCTQTSSRYSGDLTILDGNNRFIRDLCGHSFEGESAVCPRHMAVLAEFIDLENER
jgi:hypothetical protein